MKGVLIIIPCFNEELSIANTVEIIEFSGYDYVIVNDGSDDKTLDILIKKNAEFVSHDINLGQGAALRTGFKYADQNNYNFVVHFDADGQHNIEDVAFLLSALKDEGRDIVFGSRFLTADQQAVPFIKRVILKMARFFEYMRTGILLSDAHCGLRAMKVDRCRLMNLKANGMAHASEILSETKRLKLNYSEVSVKVNYDILKKQESNFTRIYAVIKELVFLNKGKT